MLRWAPAALWLTAMVLLPSTTASRLDAQGANVSRADAASTLSTSSYAEWFGVRPSTAPVGIEGALFDARAAMRVESRIAFQIARAWFGHLESTSADGIAWYLQSRIVERTFADAFRVPGYRHHATCVFGCFVPWTTPLIVSRWSDGLGRRELLRSSTGREWPALDRRPVTALDRRSVALALALGSLERELGWPTLQGALGAAADARDRRDLAAILEDATARQLDGVFNAVESGLTDHRLGRIETDRCEGQQCFITRVPIVRGGPVPFPLVVYAQFEDGAVITSRWDGRDDVFEFESATPAARVQLDPDRHWLLDRDYRDNASWSPAKVRLPIVKRIAPWIIWLQDAMLTYTFPV